jgi:quinol monooxygenase YgiN
MYIVNAFWTITAGNEKAAHAALTEWADNVKQNEPDTWMYLIHDPNFDQGINAFPPPAASQVAFIEGYKDRDAFHKHAARLSTFLAKNGNLFLFMYGPTFPFMILQCYEFADGFIRKEADDPSVFQVEARWLVKPGNMAKVRAALVDYIKAVRKTEPGTYMYTTNASDNSPHSPSIPPLPHDALTYNSSWKDHDAFVEHSQGAPYQDFLAQHGHLFVQALGAPTDKQPYMTTSVLKRFAGFFRPEAFSA